MEQDGPQSIFHSKLTNCINKQAFKNACDRLKVSNKILSLAKAVFFSVLVHVGYFVYTFSENSFFFFLFAVPTLVLPEELLFCAS